EWDGTYNFEGFLIREASDSESSASYIQIFRNGAIELADTLLLTSESGDDQVIDQPRFERELVAGLGRFLELQKSLGAEPPVFVLLSLVRVKDFSLRSEGSESEGDEPRPIDRDELVMAECIAESFDADAASVLKPAFDSIWNTAGFSCSRNYDRQGKWKG